MKKKRKQYIIKNRFRFIIFIIAIILTSTSTINAILGLNDAVSLTVKEYISIEISSGDTLWNVASIYMPSNMDRRIAVHEICTLNNITANEIHPGQIIKIPIYY